MPRVPRQRPRVPAARPPCPARARALPDPDFAVPIAVGNMSCASATAWRVRVPLGPRGPRRRSAEDGGSRLPAVRNPELDGDAWGRPGFSAAVIARAAGCHRLMAPCPPSIRGSSVQEGRASALLDLSEPILRRSCSSRCRLTVSRRFAVRIHIQVAIRVARSALKPRSAARVWASAGLAAHCRSRQVSLPPLTVDHGAACGQQSRVISPQVRPLFKALQQSQRRA